MITVFRLILDDGPGRLRAGRRQKRYDEAMQQPVGDDPPRISGSRVAFFGGSFDPPHLGHLAVARAARDAFLLDTVLFAPVGAQPLKPEGSSASFEDRLQMTRLAIEGEPGFAVSLADAPKSSGARAPEPNYTVDTLEKLRASLGPDCALYCLMGADSFLGLRRWHRAAELPLMAPLIVASRPGQPLDGLRDSLPVGLTLEPAPEGDKSVSGVDVRAFLLVNRTGDRAPFYLLPGLDVEISASEIRKAIGSDRRGRAGNAPVALAVAKTPVPGAVAEYIRSHGLYR
ncbi:MAG TPA: nicotinate (nicotinamide) nucleotide adenylyltransferase [Terriglobia bacterium]|nr:nicotinate (nicotinamide) nucleotide adenylyltransferase [Terriglobia bacterium]